MVTARADSFPPSVPLPQTAAADSRARTGLRRIGAWMGSIALLFSVLPLCAKSPGDYRLGDTLEEDVTTTVALQVVDAAGTAALREKEAARLPLILRQLPGAPEAAERELRESFAATRTNFQRAVELRFQRRTLAAAALERPGFQALIAAFGRTNHGFPLTRPLAELWAAGDTGRAVQNTVLERLRAMQERPVRLGQLPPSVSPGSRALVVTVSNLTETLTPESARQRGRNMARTNVLTLARARRDLTALFPADEQAVAKFAGSLLRQNCHFDEALALATRQQAITNLVKVDSFNPGDLVARRGEVVDERLKGILEELHTKTAATELAVRVGEEKARADRILAEAEKVQANAEESQALAAAALANAEHARRRNQWLAAGFAVATLAAGLLWWQLLRRRRRASLLPARLAGDGVPATVVSCPSCDETIVIPADTTSATDVAWQERARAAELRAQRAQAALKSSALAQFSLWLKQSFAQRLLGERSQMLDAQQCAAAELADLEQRLDELHAPLQERLRAYEKRVTELEKSLAAKGQENRELLEAKIKLTRQQLETERARREVEFN